MKKIMLSLFLLISSVISAQQINLLDAFKTAAKKDGYTVVSEYSTTLKLKETAFIERRFENGLIYKVIAFSDNLGVKDLDLRCYDEGVLVGSDITNESVAYLDFTVNYSGNLTLIVENYSSVSSTTYYNVYLLVMCR